MLRPKRQADKAMVRDVSLAIPKREKSPIK
jgi:hypothetical protein